MTQTKKVSLIILAVTAILAVFIGYQLFFDKYYDKQVIKRINNFNDCAAAGYPIQESYPMVCRTPDGRSFTQFDSY